MWQKGQSGNPKGHPKGLQNKITKIKNAIADCFTIREFKKWSLENKTDFYNLMVKTMPKELEISDTRDIIINIIDDVKKENEK